MRCIESYPTLTTLRRIFPSLEVLFKIGRVLVGFTGLQSTGRAGTAIEQLKCPLPLMRRESGTGCTKVSCPQVRWPSFEMIAYLVSDRDDTGEPSQYILRALVVPVSNK
jgi:hypothetical protein